MPQMMPMNWIMLFIFFISIYMMFNLMNYFSMNYQVSKIESLNFKKSMYNWNW